jgi:diguanylate cyclase (GGDEF)-like protein
VPAVLLGSGVLAAAAVLLIARLRPEVAVLTGCAFSGGVAALSGVLVAAGLRARPPRDRWALALIGTAMLVWGVGQAIVGGVVAGGGATFPTAGDAVSTAAAPIGITGLLLAVRVRSRHSSALRFTLDSLLLGSALTLVVWRAWFWQTLFVGGAMSADVAASAMLLLEMAIVAVLLLSYLRELDAGLLLACVGMVLYCAADLHTVHAVVQPGGSWPWLSALLWCLAWPCVAVGMLRFSLSGGRDDRFESETRVTIATALLSVAALCVFVALVVRDPRVDVGSTVVALLLVAAFGAREAVTGVQRHRLLVTLTQHAVHDPLTGLMNRRGLATFLTNAARSGDASLLTLDLAGFKELNDLLGHVRGDELLVAVSRRIEGCLPSTGRVFRIGGDEFAVVVTGDPSDVHDVGQRLLAAVRQASVDVPGAAAVGVTASIGIARVARPEPAQHDRFSVLTVTPVPEDGLGVLVESSAALGAAKRGGRDRVEYYDGDVATAHRRSLLVERRLHDAVRNGDVDVHYQPIIDLEGGRVTGVEALARWTDPVVGRVTPDEFIPLAEQSGLIRPLGSAVLRRAVHDGVSLSGRLPGLTLAVNASPVQVRQPDFAAEVLDVLRVAGMAPDRLAVEVTESVFVDADDPALGQLSQLREHGVHVAIDDFGSGFSALAYLSRLPASVLKIDQSLTRQVLGDARSLAVLQAVVSLAHTMPMSVVVEGIETGDVEGLVRSTGAAQGQGWLYCAAVPVDELERAVADVHDRYGVVAR